MSPAGYEPLKSDPENNEIAQSTVVPHTSPTLNSLRIFLVVPVFLFGTGTGFLAILFLQSKLSHFNDNTLLPHPHTTQLLQRCPASVPRAAKAPVPVNLFASLTVPETVAINEWVSSPLRNLNLTAGDKANISDNFIYRIEAYRPSKKDAVAYLDRPNEVSPPDRYAHVVIHHGAASDPYVQDHLVGPIPVSEETTIRKLTEIYHRDPIPYNARGFTTMNEIAPLFLKIMPSLAEATEVRVLPEVCVDAAIPDVFTAGSLRRGRSRTA